MSSLVEQVAVLVTPFVLNVKMMVLSLVENKLNTEMNCKIDIEKFQIIQLL